MSCTAKVNHYINSKFKDLYFIIKLTNHGEYIMKLRKEKIDGAASRNRTGTGITSRGILSPLRLPVSPSRH